jgi:hypothetical protein
VNDNVKKILDDFGKEVTRVARLNIGKTKTVNGKKRRIEYTGKLKASLGYNVDVFPNSFGFDIFMEDYGEDVDRGTPTGTQPSVPSLMTWIRKKPARLRDKQGQFIKMSNLRVKSFAESIAWKINKYGTKPTNFLTDPFVKNFKELPDEINEAFGLDVEGFLETSLSELNKK